MQNCYKVIPYSKLIAAKKDETYWCSQSNEYEVVVVPGTTQHGMDIVKVKTTSLDMDVLKKCNNYLIAFKKINNAVLHQFFASFKQNLLTLKI